jgi:hypothetical protein
MIHRKPDLHRKSQLNSAMTLYHVHLDRLVLIYMISSQGYSSYKLVTGLFMIYEPVYLLNISLTSYFQRH